MTIGDTEGEEIMDFFRVLNDFENMNIGISKINNIINFAHNAILIILCFLSIIHCFAGYKLLKWWTSFIGFIVFGLLGYSTIYHLNGDLNIAVICGIVIGLVGSMISFSLYKVAIAIIAFAGGFIIGGVVTGNVPIAVIFGLATSILVIWFMKPVLIICIAGSSGIIAGKTLSQIIGSNSDAMVLLEILFVVLGIAFQWWSNIGFSNNKIKDHERKRNSNVDRRSIFSIRQLKKNFYKLKNKIRFDDEDDDYEENDYYEDKTEYIPVNSDYSEYNNDKTVFMPKAEEKDDDVTKLLKKIDEQTKNMNYNGNHEYNMNKKSERRCSKCNCICSIHDKFCRNCGQKI